MLLLAGAALGLIAGLLTGGRFGNLAYPRLHLRWPLVPALALIVRELGVIGPLATSPALPALYIVTLSTLLVWTLWHLWELRGVWLVALGLALNLAVVAANAGHMPVAPALAARGPHELVERGVLGQYELASASTRLGWLGDWIQLPGPAGHAFPQAYSVGDILAGAGMAAVLFLATRPWRPKTGRGGSGERRRGLPSAR
jgi:hypothetical protein